MPNWNEIARSIKEGRYGDEWDKREAADLDRQRVRQAMELALGQNNRAEKQLLLAQNADTRADEMHRAGLPKAQAEGSDYATSGQTLRYQQERDKEARALQERGLEAEIARANANDSRYSAQLGETRRRNDLSQESLDYQKQRSEAEDQRRSAADIIRNAETRFDIGKTVLKEKRDKGTIDNETYAAALDELKRRFYAEAQGQEYQETDINPEQQGGGGGFWSGLADVLKNAPPRRTPGTPFER